MAGLPSILGGMAQGFLDFGKSAVDLFGTGGAAVGDLVDTIRTGKVSTKNQDDFRKWLYSTDSVQDAAAKGLGTALNGVQTVIDYIPGIGAVTRDPLFNAGQGALGGLADEFKTYGKDYDLGRAAQRAAVSAGGALASTGLADALKGSGNALLKSGTAQGLARGAVGGAISGGGYAAIDGGDVLDSAARGAGMGALLGGAMGALQDFRPAKATSIGLTDDERQARIANAQQQIDDIGPVRRFTDDPDELAKRARVNELQDAIKAYQGGFDTVDDYNAAMAAKRANKQPSLTREEYEAKMQQRAADLGGNYEVTPEKQAQFDRLQAVNPMRDNYHTGIRAPKDIATLQEAINSATDIDPEYKALLQKALNDDSITVYSSYPIEEGVFTTPIKSMAQDYAGPNNQVYSKTISPNDIAWIDNEQGNYIPRTTDLGATLAADDMAVNSAKVAPGQLGLFGDAPTQTPKTGTRQTSLFDQPQEGVDYYGSDIEKPATKPTNPYAPVDGQVTQAMRDRAADILGNWKKNGVPENELYNAINPDTLPLGYKEAIDVLDNMDAKKYLKDNLGVTDIKKAKFDKVLDYLFGDNEDAKRARIEMRDQQIESAKQKAKLLGLPGPSKNFVPTVEAQLREEVEYKMAKDISKSLKGISVDAQTGEVMPLTAKNLERLDPKKHSFRTGYTAAADEAFSERLGIAPGNTPKYNGRIDVRGAYGRYSHPMYGVGGDLAIFERKIDNPEDAISSVAHERLHSFQNETTNSANNAGRYSKEVEDAFKDLRKDLEQHYKSWDETAKRYGGGRGNVYWNSAKEQEARMLETYLQNKGYTDAPGMKNKYRAGEWGNEINPAFDKFFDKLRDLSKRGVALPALTALFGGGALMASQQKDKEEVK